MKALRCVAAATLLFGLAPDAIADGRNPGSLLVYPVHRSGGGGIEGTLAFTIVCVTNINTQPVTPSSFGGSTYAHFQYFNVVKNAADPFKPLNCVEYNQLEFLTPADTLCVLTSCHNAVPAGNQVTEGYLVVKAENPNLFNTPWSFNYLIGSEIVINAFGAVYGLNAVPFESPQPVYANTDVNGNRRCELNGVEYEPCPDQLYMPSFLAANESQLALVNLTGDARDCNTVYFTIFNDMELPMSATRPFSCWFDQPLTAVAPVFSALTLMNKPNDPTELDIDCDNDDDFETGWAIIDSLDVSSLGGFPISSDGAILGSLTAGVGTAMGSGDLLWESVDKQSNGVVFTP
jgi:hypothetical protein